MVTGGSGHHSPGSGALDAEAYGNQRQILLTDYPTKKTNYMRIKIKQALKDYNEKKGTSMSLQEFALRVYPGSKWKRDTKIQRISFLQNHKSKRSIKLPEIISMAAVLEMELGEFSKLYVIKNNPKM